MTTSGEIQQELIDFLLDRGLAEEYAGYGPATAERVADELIGAGWINPEGRQG